MKHQKLITTPETSARMAKVHLKGSKAEIALAKNLWKHGLRYRKNYKKLPKKWILKISLNPWYWK